MAGATLPHPQSFEQEGLQVVHGRLKEGLPV